MIFSTTKARIDGFFCACMSGWVETDTATSGLGWSAITCRREICPVPGELVGPVV